MVTIQLKSIISRPESDKQFNVKCCLLCQLSQLKACLSGCTKWTSRRMVSHWFADWVTALGWPPSWIEAIGKFNAWTRATIFGLRRSDAETLMALVHHKNHPDCVPPSRRDHRLQKCTFLVFIQRKAIVSCRGPGPPGEMWWLPYGQIGAAFCETTEMQHSCSLGISFSIMSQWITSS